MAIVPLGWTVFLRLLSTKPSTTAISTPVRYLPVETFVNDTLFDAAMKEQAWDRYAPLFMTTLQTARLTVNESRDLFGNVRIPDINSLDTSSDPTAQVYDWRDVQDKAEVSYTSLLGYPTIDVPNLGNVSFTIESSYWEVRCQPFQIGASFPLENQTDAYNDHLSPARLVQASTSRPEPTVITILRWLVAAEPSLVFTTYPRSAQVAQSTQHAPLHSS